MAKKAKAKPKKAEKKVEKVIETPVENDGKWKELGFNDEAAYKRFLEKDF